MIIYIPYAFDYSFDLNSKQERLTYGYAFYIILHAHLSQVAHTISIFLTIVLALFRYIAVCHPNKKNVFMKRTTLVIFFSYIISPFVCIPLFMSLTIKESYVTLSPNETEIINENFNRTTYQAWPSEFAKNQQAYLWIYSVIIKLIPCIALSYLSLQLIRALYEAKRRKAKLTGNLSIKLLTKKKQADRTTKMLIAVLLLFLITEFPQAIMGMFSAMLHKDFYHHCYQKLGENITTAYV
jgi:hypothetical protein